MSKSNLIRFWFEFEGDIHLLRPFRIGIGCGVTAYDYNDAVDLIRSELFDGAPLPKIKRVIDNIDVRTLEYNHVQRGMGVCVWRGIWWPALNL